MMDEKINDYHLNAYDQAGSDRDLDGQAEKNSLYQKMQEIEEAIDQEVADFQRKKEIYGDMQKEFEELRITMEKEAVYSPEKADNVINNIEKSYQKELDIEHLLEEKKADLLEEEAKWQKQKETFQELNEKIESYKQEIQADERFEMSRVETALELLDKLQKLTTEQDEIIASLASERENWASYQKNYQAQKEKIAALQNEITEKDRYAEENVAPIIEKIDEMIKKQELMQAELSELSADELTQEESDLLDDYSLNIPEKALGMDLLERYRNLPALLHEDKNLEESIREKAEQGEKLLSALRQLNDINNHLSIKMSPSDMPNKPYGKLISLIGIISAISSIFLFSAAPHIGQITAVVGAALIVYGIFASRNYKNKKEAYDKYTVELAKKHEIEKHQEEIKRRLAYLTDSITQLEKQMEVVDRDIRIDRRNIGEWVEKWVPDYDQRYLESTLVNLIALGDKLRLLQSKKTVAEEKRDHINEVMLELEREKKSIEIVYPETAEKTLRAVSDLLQVGEAEYQNLLKDLKDEEASLHNYLVIKNLDEKAAVEENSPEIKAILEKEEQWQMAWKEVRNKWSGLSSAYPELEGKEYDEAAQTLRFLVAGYQKKVMDHEEISKQLADYLNEIGYNSDDLSEENSPVMVSLREQIKNLAAEKEASSVNPSCPLYPEISEMSNKEAIEYLNKKKEEYQELANKVSEAADNLEEYSKNIGLIDGQWGVSNSPMMGELLRQQEKIRLDLSKIEERTRTTSSASPSDHESIHDGSASFTRCKSDIGNFG